MALVADIRRTVTDATPVYAAVGLTDLAVEKVREARTKANAARVELDGAALQAQASEQVKELPALALNRGLELAGKAQESYATFASRGEKLLKRVRTQKATTDLIAQAEATTVVKKSAPRTRTAAKRTATTTRKSASASKTAAKRATTGARKTAAASTKAGTTAAAKIGD